MRILWILLLLLQLLKHSHGFWLDASYTYTGKQLKNLENFADRRISHPFRQSWMSEGLEDKSDRTPIWVTNSTLVETTSGQLQDGILTTQQRRTTVLPNNPPDSIEVRAPPPGSRLFVSRSEEPVSNQDAMLDPPLTTMEGKFVDMFRSAAPYIRRHRGTTMIIHIPGALLGTHTLDQLMADIALISLLGVKLVLVAGARQQIDAKLMSLGLEASYYGNTRITDSETLQTVKEMSGFARFEVESRLARSLEGGMGTRRVQVVGGNFYTAQPLGVRDGIDFGYTGKVRRVEKESLEARMDAGDIIVLTSVGYSASGEIFNVNSEHLAAQVAGHLKASKVIFITEGQQLVDKRTGKLVQSLRRSDAKEFLKYHSDITREDLEADLDENCRLEDQVISRECKVSSEPYLNNYFIVSTVRGCTEALKLGCTRAHIIGPHPGALVQELYTRDGAGTLIAKDLYDDIRQATVQDIPGIVNIIRPLEEAGYLVPRPMEQIEKEIDHFYVFVREEGTVAVATLVPFDEEYGEIGCFAVAPKYRKAGRGDAMLAYMERISAAMGIKKLFVLSTQTMQWFIERGFGPVSVEALPPSRYATYNWQRRARVYMKDVKHPRDLDAEELFMNVNDL